MRGRWEISQFSIGGRRVRKNITEQVTSDDLEKVRRQGSSGEEG